MGVKALFCNTKAIKYSNKIWQVYSYPVYLILGPHSYHVRGGEGALSPITYLFNPVWKPLSTYGAAYWHLKLSLAWPLGCSSPFKSQSFLLICLVSSFSDPPVSTQVLVCRAILLNLSRFSWSHVPWGLVLGSFSTSCFHPAWLYLSCCMGAGLALLQGHSHPITGRRKGKIIWVSNCPKIWLGTPFHRKMPAKESIAGRACQCHCLLEITMTGNVKISHSFCTPGCYLNLLLGISLQQGGSGRK